MTGLRFDYQKDAVRNTTGLVLNVGSYDDPAGVKMMAPSRVLNCDINNHNNVDIVFDMRSEWPFESDSAELIILGDVVEHLFPREAVGALTEARRVSQRVVLTVPEDSRHEGTEVYEEDEVGARHHCYTWTEQRLKTLLEGTGWKIVDWREEDYSFVPRGFFVTAERTDRLTNPHLLL